MKPTTSLTGRVVAGLSRYRAQTAQLFARAAIVILVLAAVIAGYLYWKQISFVLPISRTPQGQLLEALLPENTNFVFSYNPSDTNERARFNTLWNIVLQDKKESLLPLVAQEFTTANNFDLSLEDIISIFGENFSFVLALTGDPDADMNDTKSGSTGSSSTKSAGVKPDITGPQEFYFIFSAEDSARALTILEKNKSSLSGKVQFGVIEDIAFMTNAGDKAASELIARSRKKIPTGLAGTKLFRESVSHFSQPFSGYLFTVTANNNLFISAKVGDYSAVRSSAVSMHSETGGLRFQTYTLGDKKRLAEPGTNLAYIFEPYSAYLYKKIPGSNSMLFAESHRLGSLAESQLKVIAPMILMTPENLFTQFETYTGFNFHEDIVPFMDKGFAVTIQDSGAIIPAISLFVDAGAAPEKAKAVVEELDFHVPDWVAYINLALQAPEEEPIMEMDNFNDIKTGAGVKIHLNRLPKTTANIPLFDLSGALEISYGITEDNILFFSTIPNFEDTLKAVETIENSVIFQEIGATDNSIDNSIGSFVVIDGEAIGNYANHAVESVRKNNSFSQTNEAGFAILQKHLAPIKSFFQNNQGDSTNIFGHAFLRISQ